MVQYTFFFDESRCIDCRACSVACRDWHDIESGPVKWLRRFSWEEGIFTDVTLHFLFAPCYHCEEPLCVEACPHGAIFKEDEYGAVLVDSTKCQGERECFNACPYGAPQFKDDEPATKMSKCNMCIERLEAGEMPVCVMSCPTRALDFGPKEEIEAKYGKEKSFPGLPAPNSKPAIIFKYTLQHQKLLRFDAQKAFKLLTQREELPPLFEGQPEDVPSEIIAKNRLVLKPQSGEELLFHTRNDEG